MKTTFASDAMTFPDAAVEEDCSESLLSLEKRKHAESPQSLTLPLPTKKRIRCENDRESLIKDYELNIFNTFSVKDQNSILEHRARFGFGLRIGGLGIDLGDDEQIGDLGDLLDHDPNRDYSHHVCSNPFTPLEFKQDPKLYDGLKDFGVKAVVYCNRLYKEGVVFDEIESVTSCHADCQHHLVTLKVFDPSENKSKEIVLRGKAPTGIPDAKDFIVLSYTPV